MIRQNTIIVILIFLSVKIFAQAPYLGGNGNGFSNGTATINLSITDSIYNGGNGNGFIQQLQTGLDLVITDSSYNGGNGDGFHTGLSTSLDLLITDSLYNGGDGKGEVQLQTTVNLGSCGSDTFIWTGNTSSTWNNTGNWDCNVVPGINSVVIIPSGLTRYPAISATREIKTLILKPGAGCTLNPGAVLILNGN